MGEILDLIFCNKSNVIIRVYSHEKMFDLLFCNTSSVIIRIYFHWNMLDLIFCNKSIVTVEKLLSSEHVGSQI